MLTAIGLGFSFLGPYYVSTLVEILMDMSVQNTVGTAAALQDFNAQQEAQNNLLKKVMDSNQQLIMGLVNSVPKLATSGSVGTIVNTVA